MVSTIECPIMRLLNVYNLRFTVFDGDNIPPYTITSHRWTENEACFKDVDRRKNTENEGYKKVEGFCSFVQAENERRNALHGDVERCDWIWLDTACIDKRAKVCYAYLFDVRPLSAGRDAVMSDFARSTWFTRGWYVN